MERQPAPATQSSSASVAERLLPHGRLGGDAVLGGVLLALAAAAWVLTARRMTGMDAGPWTDPGPLGFYISTWVLMMAAMMTPSLAPVLLGHAALQRAADQNGRATHAMGSGLFLLGYLTAWGAAGLVGYALLEAVRSLDGGVFDWSGAGRWIAAGALLMGCLYQFTPAKRACLARCRAARTLRSEDPRTGGLRAGIRHGVWCLGCCWALMAALFALGAMSVAWMLVISALIACERLLPWRRLGAIGVAAVLAAVAIGLAAAPARVPMLTIPGSPAAMRAMGMSSPRHMRMPEPARMEPHAGSMAH
jgi:predicted metal-binding membrane protein